MSKYRKLPVVIEAISFEELIEYGRAFASYLHTDGMPWSFSYKGHAITHENNTCYLLPTLEGIMPATPDDMVIIGVNGEIYACKKDIFNKTYEKVGD